MVVALDDEVGHTMYEGRAPLQPATPRGHAAHDPDDVASGLQPVTFTNIHHIVVETGRTTSTTSASPVDIITGWCTEGLDDERQRQ